MTMMFVSEVFVDYFIKFLVKMHKEQMLESFFLAHIALILFNQYQNTPGSAIVKKT